MDQQDDIERIKKRELRTIHRNNRLAFEQSKRSQKNEKIKKQTDSLNTAAQVLLEDNKAIQKSEKKPGSEFFLPMYSYIPNTPFDLRHNIPSSWKPHSFNERKQHLEFIKRFIYPYQIPEALIWAAHELESKPDWNGVKRRSKDFLLILLAKKWIIDITGGKSFYKQNREYFTKAEAHHFLISKIPYVDTGSALKMYFYAKCRARAMNHKLSIVIAEVFTIKFFDKYIDNLVIGFMDLLARTPDYNYERGMLGDLCDFVIEKINDNNKNKKNRIKFSFSGRTIYSVIVLVNEWHESLRKAAEAQQTTREAARIYRGTGDSAGNKSVNTSFWRGMGIEKFNYETKECVWTITELLTSKEILYEGNKMKNCLASYIFRCASGESAIFTVECFYPVSQHIEKTATLEVNPAKRTLIQAKEKCNAPLSPKTTNVVKRWAAANGVRVQLLI